MRITFGKPIPWQTFDKRFSDAQWAEMLRIHVYKLAVDSAVEFKP
jgi:hypothetical protein